MPEDEVLFFGNIKYIIKSDDRGNQQLFREDTLIAIYQAPPIDTTTDLETLEVMSGNQLKTLVMVQNRFYVYALINPKTKECIYIGKGTGDRKHQHYKDAQNTTQNTNRKIQEIQSLIEEQNCNYSDISRVIARNLNEHTALAIESALIKSVYPNLTNIQAGHHSERFRSKDDWSYSTYLDLPIAKNGEFCRDTQRSDRHYVYALIDPESNQIFYVGKGVGPRIQNHFNEAKKAFRVDEDPGEKLDTIRRLLQTYQPKDIGRVVARVESDDLALWLESLWMKFICSLMVLSNSQDGKYSLNIRSQNAWELMPGFDTPGRRRMILNGLYYAEKLDDLLRDVVAELKKTDDPSNPDNLIFSDPEIYGADEFATHALLDKNIKITIHARFQRTIQVSLNPRGPKTKRTDGSTIDEAQWIIQHFKRLGAYPVRRYDNVFSAEAWESPSGLARTPEIAASRLRQLIILARTPNSEQLPNDLKYMLDNLPPRKDLCTAVIKLYNTQLFKKGDSILAKLTISRIYKSKSRIGRAGSEWGYHARLTSSDTSDALSDIAISLEDVGNTLVPILKSCALKAHELGFVLKLAGLSQQFTSDPEDPCKGMIDGEHVYVLSEVG